MPMRSTTGRCRGKKTDFKDRIGPGGKAMNIFAPRFLGQAYLPPTIPPIAPPTGVPGIVQIEDVLKARKWTDELQRAYEEAKRQLEILDKEGVEFDDPRYQDAVYHLNRFEKELVSQNEFLDALIRRVERKQEGLMEFEEAVPPPPPPILPPAPIPPPAPWKFERTASLPATPKAPLSVETPSVTRTQCPTGFVVDMRTGECVPSTAPTMPTATPGRFGINPFSGLFAGGGGMTASGFASLGWPPRPMIRRRT